MILIDTLEITSYDKTQWQIVVIKVSGQKTPVIHATEFVYRTSVNFEICHAFLWFLPYSFILLVSLKSMTSGD